MTPGTPSTNPNSASALDPQAPVQTPVLVAATPGQAGGADPAKPPRIDPRVGNKIKVLAFLLILQVVIDHGRNLDFRVDQQLQTVTVEGDLNLANHPLLVFFQHFWCGALGRTCVPFFFLASGYLMFAGWQLSLPVVYRKLRKRFLTVFVPFLMWEFIGMIVYYVAFFIVPNLRSGRMGEVMEAHGWLGTLGMILSMPGPYQLWYMRDLSVIMLYSPVLLLVLPWVRRWAIVFFLGLFCFTDVNTQLWVPLAGWLDIDRAGICFFSIGATLGGLNVDVSRVLPGRPRTWLVGWVTVALAFTFLSLLTHFNLTWLYRLLILVGVVSAWRLYDAVPDAFWAGVMQPAKYRFFIFVAHEPMLTILKNLYFSVWAQSAAANLVAFLALPAAACLVCYTIAVNLRRRFERFYLLLSGGR